MGRKRNELSNCTKQINRLLSVDYNYLYVIFYILFLIYVVWGAENVLLYAFFSTLARLS